MSPSLSRYSQAAWAHPRRQGSTRSWSQGAAARWRWARPRSLLGHATQGQARAQRWRWSARSCAGQLHRSRHAAPQL